MSGAVGWWRAPHFWSNRGPTGRGTWYLLFLLLFVVIGAWSASQPLFSYPDEGAQTVKAQAVAHGQLTYEYTPSDQPSIGKATAPLAYKEGIVASLCFIFSPGRPASCAGPFQNSDRPVTLDTYVSRYPPLYYLLVAPASLVSSPSVGLYLMRLLSAAVSAAFLASALVSALRLRSRPFLPLGVAVAMTPTAVYMASAVNPNGLEISSALCLWTAGLVYLCDGSAGDLRLLSRVGLSAAVLVSMRGLSPLWLALIGLALLALCSRRRLRGVARRTSVRVWAGVVVAVTVAAVAWIVAQHTLRIGGSGVPAQWTLWHIVTDAASFTLEYLREMVNVFAPYPYPAPSSPAFVWGLVTVALLALAMTSRGVARPARRRTAAVILALIVAVLLIPIVIDTVSARTEAFEWQGRYTLPLAVGIPVLAAYALGNDERLTRPPTLRLTAGVITFALVAEQIHQFVWTMHRYMVGINGPLDFLSGPWQPPAPPLLLTAAFVASVATLGVMLYLRTVSAGEAAASAASAASGRPSPIGDLIHG